MPVCLCASVTCVAVSVSVAVSLCHDVTMSPMCHMMGLCCFAFCQLHKKCYGDQQDANLLTNLLAERALDEMDCRLTICCLCAFVVIRYSHAACLMLSAKKH